MLKKLHKALTAKANQDSMLIANAMFTKEGFPMEETFVATNKANFQCESRSLDFRHPQKAADEINEWVSNKTKGRSLFIFVSTKEAVSVLHFASSLVTRRFSLLQRCSRLLYYYSSVVIPLLSNLSHQIMLPCIFIQGTSPA